VALPWLEAFGGETPPIRVAWLYVPNGVHMPDWTPASEGAAFPLPPLLEPLERFRDRLLVLTGLAHDKARANGDGPGDHARSAAAFLTGAQPRKTDGAGIRAGVSADQVAAQAVGNRTRFRSLEIGCEPGMVSGQCDSGYSCAYSSNISWASPQTPMAKETDPRLLFDRLFGRSPEADARRKSVLDVVRGEASSLAPRLGASDRRKLDEYLTGVRELERRIERAEKGAEVPDSLRPKGIPSDYGEHLRVMADLLALAFRTDATRIATFMFANEGSNRSYAAIGVPEGHHELSHHGGDAAKQAKIGRINRFHLETLAHLLGRLDGVREGGEPLLDRCLVVYGSAISDGNRHNHDDLPLLVAGGSSAIRTGRHLRLPRETPMNNLHLALLGKLGVPAGALGDSTGVLDL
jgi:hypothetical protein